MLTAFKSHALFMRKAAGTRRLELGMVPADFAVRRLSGQSYPLQARCPVKADAVPAVSSPIGLIVSAVSFACFVLAAFAGARFEARAVPANRPRLIVSYANLGDF